jgi:hypothetical protein
MFENRGEAGFCDRCLSSLWTRYLEVLSHGNGHDAQFGQEGLLLEYATQWRLSIVRHWCSSTYIDTRYRKHRGTRHIGNIDVRRCGSFFIDLGA